MTPLLTADAVSRLPLEGGRAELLEAVLAEPVATARTAPRWLAPLAAAAVVVAVVGCSVAWAHLREGTGRPAPAGEIGRGTDQAIVLDAPGWRVESLASDGMQFVRGGAQLEITAYDAASYDSYVEDREHIPDIPGPGRPVTVLGAPGQLWAYDSRDHTVIREVEDGQWLELRGSGLDLDAYLQLLGRLRFTSQAEFEATLPDGTVVPGEREAAAARILAGIEERSGAGFPRGETPSFTEGAAEDRYQFGAEVAGAYTCAWLTEFENATAHQQPRAAREALLVLASAREWPILEEMEESGAYPQVVRQLVDDARTGDLTPSWREGLGCQ
jgi:hypothetical protein